MPKKKKTEAVPPPDDPAAAYDPDPMKHTGFAKFWINTYARQAVAVFGFEDVYQSVMLGLVRASKKYEKAVEKPAKFITYAAFYAAAAVKQLYVANRRFRYVRPYKTGVPKRVTLFSEIGPDVAYGNANLFARDDPGPSRADAKQDAAVLLKRLDVPNPSGKGDIARRKRFVKRHFGLDGRKPLGFAAMSRAYDLSVERVRQVVMSGLRALEDSPQVRRHRQEEAQEAREVAELKEAREKARRAEAEERAVAETPARWRPIWTTEWPGFRRGSANASE